MKVNDIFKKVREYKGIKQQYVATEVGIAHPSLSGFEKAKSTLSKVKQIEIAKLLGLNPDYIEGKVRNPFDKSYDPIKMFVKEGILLDNFEPLDFVSQFNDRIKLVGLIAPPEALTRIYRKLGIPWIYAISFMDDLGNIFLIRGKKDLINFAVDWQYLRKKILKISEDSNCTFSVAQKETSIKLFNKIKSFDPLSKRSIEDLFKDRDLKFEEIYPPGKETDEESLQRKLQRGLGVEPFSELDIVVIKAMREAKVPHQMLLTIIKAIQEGKVTEDEFLNFIKAKK